MLYILQKVIRSLLVLIRKGCEQKSKRPSPQGGLMVLLSTRFSHSTYSVAMAGPWCLTMSKEHVKKEATERLSSFISPCDCPHPDDLHAFSDKFGVLHFVCSFQMVQESQEAEIQIEKFLQRLSLVYAQVTIVFKVRSKEHSNEQVFSVKNRIAVEHHYLATDSNTFGWGPPFMPLPCCSRMHPILEERLSLPLPLDVVEAGLCGEVNLAIIAALGPCMEQYPNWPTRISSIKVLVYSPSGIAVMHGNSQTRLSFFTNLEDPLKWRELGLAGVRSAQIYSTQDALHCEMKFSIDEENIQENESPWSQTAGQGLENCTMEQTITLFLLLQYQDPFHSQLSDFIMSEDILERHLDRVLLHNDESVKSAIWSVLKNTLRRFQKRKKSSEKLKFAVPVILNTVNSIVSSSSSVEFRSACMNSMKVQNTHDLSVSLHQALQEVISRRFVLSNRCTTEKAEGTIEQNENKNLEGDSPGLPSKRVCRRMEQSPLISQRYGSGVIAGDSHTYDDAVCDTPHTQVESKWLQELENLSDWD